MFLRYFGRFRLRSVSVAVQNDWTEPKGHFRSVFAVSTQKYGLARQSLSEILLYKTDNEEVKVEILLLIENLWLTQAKMAELFDVQKAAISKHLKNIFESGELDEKVVVSKMETTTPHGAIAGKEQTKLTFKQIEEIAGVPIDHSFLTYKKELPEYGYKVGKISLKEQAVSFEKI